MRSSLLALALALVASANAASFSKRDVTPAVQTCIKDLTAAQNQLTIVATAVNGFTSSSGYAGALSVHSKEQTLENLIKQANTDCCAVTTVVSTEDANAVLAVVQTLVPDIESALDAIVTKKPQFDAVPLATSIVKGDIKNLQAKVTTLDNCILAVTPSDFTTAANEYVGRINNAFSKADTAYGI
ncbi:hypothetical protein G6F70_001635 [Rhizopus microsporus]|uniref:Hydrophobic surface binding protein n=2 Tax=Rhizopus TaxID=4842 RepID=A0A367JCJ8_RHIAZ|nr:hypothetical protein G6F71_000443 [Rhizopus microsporus]RCH87605.1 hypothetical protein CU097_009020 [Rhizopus azygosporus]KAG1203147.1 hypothetical protein G6F70_001635 [Rhizopus microsporus]KAG1215600.1 hypothetical protein G6F69_000864 [Rhizopus microsporus]KAG1238122.1 hypothetical protein G6F67_000678 [Rhizopus microsporus]